MEKMVRRLRMRWSVLVIVGGILGMGWAEAQNLDREKIVRRHTLENLPMEVEIPLGNGEFCFNVDGTGVQTLRGNTMAHWGWHSFPLPEGFSEKDIPATGTFQQGRNTLAGDHSFPPEKQALRQWLFDNPHRADLVRIQWTRGDGTAIPPEAIRQVSRKMDLWTGLHRCEWILDGETVVVETVVGMESDALAVQVHSPLLAVGKLIATLDFPYPTIISEAYCGNFQVPEKHRTTLLSKNDGDGVKLRRNVDDLEYRVQVGCCEAGKVAVQPEIHRVTITSHGETLAFFCHCEHPTSLHFQPNAEERENFDFARWKEKTAEKWVEYWKSGAAVDFSESTDSRWRELERRVVLSQYLMRSNSAGSWPPAETGLLGTDFWRGQFHGEMIYWHLAHYALWNRWELAQPALKCYARFLPTARQLASQLGYRGAQWPKSVGPEGRSAPWVGNQVLLWKQPHPILFAELEYRHAPTRETLEKWEEIVEQTAEFMADYPEKGEDGLFHLRPVMPPSEQGITVDSVFDLAYWRWGLEQANRWRERLGKERNGQWDEIRKDLAPLPTLPGTPEKVTVYIHSAEWTDTYEKYAWEHPNPVGVYGMIPPTEGVCPEIARRTVRKIQETWNWERVWGWDFPWTAMAAARTGQPEIAVEILLHPSPRNAYDLRGVNANNPCPYLPGNGGVLYAVGMMVGGWEGCPQVDRSRGEAPGFPRNGKWVIRWEGFCPAP
ncbi:MAG: hypothetical protein Q4D62_01465 [Planctomycetia bacterium]|nr:hypothetical protein [Planctomycetia bacterium]